MSSQSTAGTFSQNRLTNRFMVLDGGQFDANQNLPKGSAIAKITAAAVNAQISFTTSGASAGTVTFQWLGQSYTLAYNADLTAFTAFLNQVIGSGNYSVTGTGLLTGFTVTLTGIFAGLSVLLPVVIASSLVGAPLVTATVAAGVPGGRHVPWDPTKVVSPAAAPSVSGTGTGGAWGVAPYHVQITWYNANGETLASPTSVVTLTSGQQIRIAAIASGAVPAGASGINVYVNGVFVQQIALVSNAVPQTDIAGFGTSALQRPIPLSNTALRYTDGRQILRGFTDTTFNTDSRANVIPGTIAAPAMLGAVTQQGGFAIGGEFRQADIIGVSDWSEFLSQTKARITEGTVAAGNAVFEVMPFGDSRS